MYQPDQWLPWLSSHQMAFQVGLLRNSSCWLYTDVHNSELITWIENSRKYFIWEITADNLNLITLSESSSINISHQHRSPVPSRVEEPSRCVEPQVPSTAPAHDPTPQTGNVTRFRTGPTVIRAKRNTLPTHLFEQAADDPVPSPSAANTTAAKPKPAPKPKPMLKPKPSTSNRASSSSAFSASLRFAQNLEQTSHVTHDENSNRTERKALSRPPQVAGQFDSREQVERSATQAAPVKAFYRPTIIRATNSPADIADRKPQDSSGSETSLSSAASQRDMTSDSGSSVSKRSSGSVKDLIKNFPPTIIRPATYKPPDPSDAAEEDVEAFTPEVPTVAPKARPRSMFVEGMKPAMSMPNVYKPTILRPVAISLDDNDTKPPATEQVIYISPLQGLQFLRLPYLFWCFQPSTLPLLSPSPLPATVEQPSKKKQAPPRPTEGPKRPPRPAEGPRRRSSNSASSTSPALPQRPTAGHPLYHYVAEGPHAIALFDYDAQRPDEISFKVIN